MRSRTLRWDGCVNVRDLGGHPTEDGGETRYGAVVRADNIRQLTEEGWHDLAVYGVRTVVDLRFDTELAEDPAREVDVHVVHVPLLGEPGSLADVDELLVDVEDTVEWRRISYLAFLERFPGNFARAVTAIGRSPEGAVLVHCAGGVDRTGLVAALILRVAGVSIDAIAADYAVSEASWAPHVDEWISEASDDRERRTRLHLSVMPAEAMHTVLTELERRHDGAWGYLRDAGTTDEDIRAVRARLRG